MKRIIVLLAIILLPLAFVLPASAATHAPNVPTATSFKICELNGTLHFCLGAACDTCRMYESETGRQWETTTVSGGWHIELSTDTSKCIQATTNGDVYLSPCVDGGTTWAFLNQNNAQYFYLISVKYVLDLSGQGCNECYLSIQEQGKAGYYQKFTTG